MWFSLAVCCVQEQRDRNHLPSSAVHVCCCVLGQESLLCAPDRDSEDGQESWGADHTHTRVDRQECAVCVFVCLLRQGTSRWMSKLIIGHTEKILNFYLVWGSKALVVVKGNALSTLPSSSYHAGF